MLRRIALWSLCGLAVALFWFFYILAIGPGHGSDIPSAILCITAPIALLRHYPIKDYEFISINAVTYGLLGFAVEMIRMAIAGKPGEPRRENPIRSH
jgi:hypothetical protein